MTVLTMFRLLQSSRADIIGAVNGAKDGANYWHPKVRSCISSLAYATYQ